jgi:CubicO group peptidase (beta-lactamase class C family)
MSSACRWLIISVQVLCGASAFASPWSDSVKVRVDEAVAKHFKIGTQVGVVVGVINGDESYVWSYGERVKGSGESPTGDTFFEMGSITKTFTNTMLALEVIHGKVRLEDQLQSLWPEIQWNRCWSHYTRAACNSQVRASSDAGQFRLRGSAQPL